MAHHLTWLVMHRHHTRGMAQCHTRGHLGVPRQCLAKFCFVSVQDVMGLRMRRSGQHKTGNNCRRPAISAHRVNGNDYAPIAKGSRNI